jgi:hypothetical protein
LNGENERTSRKKRSNGKFKKIDSRKAEKGKKCREDVKQGT